MFGRAHSLMLEIERANQQSIGYRACAQGDERRGRPSFHITEEQLSFFIEQGFKVKDISSMLNVSVRTVERRMAAFGLSVSGTYSSIEDSQLDEIITCASNEHPGIGIRMLQGYLKGNGYRVQRERIRFSLLRTDPLV
ncbi:hypothetical protein OS493_033846 [Desmophyllum pertusum]|uniref:Uncharacterized protein n=1 Tax=Desmophyllum pertusum TaxID=174260 RepID=A0A9W9YIT1_9CNID|nr:hypothetical protein OS493_033846 [Desmophyllum pertusum]